MQRSATSGSDTVTESYLYSYVSQRRQRRPAGQRDPAAAGQRRLAGRRCGRWPTPTTTAPTSYGNAGDLKTAAVEDGGGNVLDTTYYRYYTAGDAPAATPHGLKYVFGADVLRPAGRGAGHQPVDRRPTAQVAPYADNYFQYDSAQRVTEEVVAGAGLLRRCSGGLGTYTYSYTASSNTPRLQQLGDEDGRDAARRQREHRLHQRATARSCSTVYHDTDQRPELGHLLRVRQPGPASSCRRSPSAVTGYSDSYADLLHNVSGNYQYLSDSSGLITMYDYYASTTATATTAGGVAGYLQDTKIAAGRDGHADPAEQPAVLRAHRPAASPSTRWPPTRSTATPTAPAARRPATATPGSAAPTQMQSVTVTLPVISAAQNGPGTADVTTTFFDTYGRPIWSKDADGFLNYTAYDLATGAVVKTIADVNTADTGDFSDLPSRLDHAVGRRPEPDHARTQVDAPGPDHRGDRPQRQHHLHGLRRRRSRGARLPRLEQQHATRRPGRRR